MEYIDCGSLYEFTGAILETLGASSDDASDLADVLIWADRRGVVGHGAVRRLSQIAKRVSAGGSSVAAKVSVRDRHGGLIFAEAHRLWGQLAARRAMELAIESAESFGVGVVAMSDTSTPGALGYYPTLATERGMVGVLLTNCQPLIAVPDTPTPVLGNQAHAFGFPRDGREPLVFDSSLTKISTTRLKQMVEAGEDIPDGLLRDSSGKPTVDPEDLMTGTLEPIGGYKGFGLGLCFELLTAGLSFSSRSSVNVTSPENLSEPQGVSLTAVAINANAHSSTGGYSLIVERVLAEIESVQSGAVHFPGDSRVDMTQHADFVGIPVGPEDLKELLRLGESLGVDGSKLVRQ